MAMLRHLLPAIETKPALLVMTVRDAVGTVAATLAEVQERLPTTHVPLSGLNVEDVAEVLERAGVVRVGRGRVTGLEPHRLRAYIF